MFKRTISRDELERYFQFYEIAGIEAQDQLVIELRERGYVVLHYSLHIKPSLSQEKQEYYRALRESMEAQIEQIREFKAKG